MDEPPPHEDLEMARDVAEFAAAKRAEDGGRMSLNDFEADEAPRARG